MDKSIQGDSGAFQEKADKICISDEKMRRIMLKYVKNNKKNIVLWAIEDLLEKRLTWSQISKKFKGINRSSLFRIYKGEYWPKNKEKELNLFKKALELL